MNVKRIRFAQVFFGGALLYFLAVLPFLIYHDGIFFYYGDYNVQQVPFYILAHRAVRSGNFFWNSKVDLGSSMGGSFAFYLWGSPFFWLSCIFPEKWVPYLMPFFMMLKYGTAAASSFAFFTHHVRTERGAVLGGFLYAFAGIMSVNIVFQHFHDSMCFFPLYLLSFEHFIRGERSGSRPHFVRDRLFFVLMTALMAAINYFFFYEDVLFIVLYYFFCLVPGSGKSFGGILKEILHLLFFGVLGLCCVAFYLIQILDILSGNSRISDMLTGYDMLFYSEPTTYGAILKSLFMTPDIIGRGTLFTNEQVKNSSLSGYIPMYAISGVIAYFCDHGKTRLKRFLSFLGIAALIPILNGAFAMFNTEYYARWFYMPVLIMITMTVRELEESRIASLKKGFFVCLIADALLCLFTLLPTTGEDGSIAYFSLLQYPKLFVSEAVVSIFTLCLFGFLLYYPAGFEGPFILRDEEGRGRFAPSEAAFLPRDFIPEKAGLVTRRVLIYSLFSCLLATMAVLWSGNSLIAKSGGTKWKSQLLDNVPELPDLDETQGQFFRTEADGTSTNYEMVWGFPTIHCFESTVEPSIVDFYEGIGRSRTVDSKMNFTHPGARALLSARYYFENVLIHQDETYEDKGGILGYEQKNQSDGYQIYENTCWIPMGFTFDSYISEDDFGTVVEQRTLSDRLLVKDIILSDEVIAAYGDLMTRDTDYAAADTSAEAFYQNCADRKSTACSTFAFDNDGFSCTVEMSKENLLFISVPWDRGWRAQIDGNSAEIVKADFGLMAIAVPEGTHTIRFDFRPWGLYPCILLSILAALLVLVFSVISIRKSSAKVQRSGQDQAEEG